MSEKYARDVPRENLEESARREPVSVEVDASRLGDSAFFSLVRRQHLAAGQARWQRRLAFSRERPGHARLGVASHRTNWAW
jgi:hypothetical protein